MTDPIDAAYTLLDPPARRHPSGRLRRTELSLRLNNLVYIESVVLRCGAHVEALSPPALRERVRDTLKAALALYR